MKQSFAPFALCLSLIGNACADSYTVDSRHTFPSFEISHVGFSTQRGRFNQTSGRIQLDAKTQTGHIAISIAADSIDTGLAELEDKLKSREFLDVAQFPTLTFKADAVQFIGDTPTTADGTLTLHGVSKPVKLTIEHFRCGIHPANKRQVCGADATTTIQRSDFGLTAFLPAVGDEVKILLQVEAYKD